MRWQCSAIPVLLCLICVVSGCAGSNRGAIRGKVTVNGTPLKEGQISFVPADRGIGPTAGATIADGSYTIDAAQGPFAGEHRVQINAFRKTGKKIWDGMGDEKAPTSQKNFVEEVEDFIPRKYNAVSELRITIKSGEVNVCDVELRIDGKK